MNSLTLHQPDFFVCTPLHITNLDMDRDFTRTKLLRRGDGPSECTPKTFHCRICVQFRILKKLRLSKKTKNKQTSKKKKENQLVNKDQDSTDPTCWTKTKQNTRLYCLPIPIRWKIGLRRDIQRRYLLLASILWSFCRRNTFQNVFLLLKLMITYRTLCSRPASTRRISLKISGVFLRIVM